MGCMTTMLIFQFATARNITELKDTTEVKPTREFTTQAKTRHPDGRDNEGYLWINGKTPADKNENGKIDEWEKSKRPIESNAPEGQE